MIQCFGVNYRGADKFVAQTGKIKLHSLHFMELGNELPHSQETTTCL